MMRSVLVGGLATACWSSTAGRPAEPGKADRLQLELAASRQEIEILERRLREMTGETEVQDSAAELSALGVNATPSFFINGRYLAGAQPLLPGVGARAWREDARPVAGAHAPDHPRERHLPNVRS